VLLNWNGKHHLERCLPSLAAQTFQDYEIILVDNGSTDGSVAYVQANYPAVQLIQNGENLGFAAANNQGMAQARGRYVIVLNNDTELDPRWLENLVAAAESHPEMGAFACLVLFDAQRDIIDSAGITVSVLGHGFQNRLGQSISDGVAAEEVFGVCAAAAMYRKELLQDVGLFDADYFIYYEDVDLAWRARLRGWRSLLVPQSIVYHVHSATVGRASPAKKRLLVRNRLWTIVKDYPFPAVLAFALPIAAFELAAVVLALARGDTAPLTGLRESLGGMRIALRKRAEIQAGRRATFRQLAPLMHWVGSPLDHWRRRGRVGKL
jgi:GT2 family glycosyltransferase